MDDTEESKFKVEFKSVEVGGKYPVYGMITNILNDEEHLVEINYSMRCYILLSGDEDNSKWALVKSRSLEPGIFMTTITHIGDKHIEGVVTTTIFGKTNTSEDFDC